MVLAAKNTKTSGVAVRPSLIEAQYSSFLLSC
jgi:hypothetical protein